MRREFQDYLQKRTEGGRKERKQEGQKKKKKKRQRKKKEKNFEIHHFWGKINIWLFHIQMYSSNSTQDMSPRNGRM